MSDNSELSGQDRGPDGSGASVEPDGVGGLPAPRIENPSPHLVTVEGLDRVYDRRLMMVVLVISLIMALLQVSSVNVTLDTLSKSLGASQGQLQWVLSGYALAIGIVLVPAGRLGDIFGRRLMFVIGLAAFGLTSAACGMATDATTLNVLRIFQGVSAGIFSPQTTGIIQQFFHGQARAKAYAMMGLAVGATVGAGPVLSGFLIGALGTGLGWRVTFFLNLPLGILGAFAAARWLPTRGKRTKEQRDKAKSRIDLDPVGMVLLATSVLGVMLPFILKGAYYTWFLLPLSVGLLGLWIWWELRYKSRGSEPMVDLSLFRMESFSFGTSVTAIQFLGQTSVFALFAIYLQEGFGYSAFAVGLMCLPNAIASGIASVVSGGYSLKYGRGLQAAALGIILFSLALAVGAAWMVESGYSPWWMAAALTVTGLGQGIMGSANSTQSMLDVPAFEGGTAGGVQQTVQRIATAIGNTILTALYFVLGGVGTDGRTSTVALSAAYGGVAFFVLVSMLVAVEFWRRGRR